MASGIERFRCQDGTVEIHDDKIIMNFTDMITINKAVYGCCTVYDFQNMGIKSHITYTFVNGRFDTAHMYMRGEDEKRIKSSFRKVE